VSGVTGISSVADKVRDEALQVPTNQGMRVSPQGSFHLNLLARQKAMVRVVIYSDQPILAAGLERVIADDPELESSGWCSTISTLRERLANENPDLAVVDLTPQITITTLKELQDLNRECKLILWTDPIAGDVAMQALTIGIRGVLRKTLPLEAHRQCFA